MTKQTINIGSSPNKGDGDPLRTAFDKVNNNFDELYARAASDIVLSSINASLIPDTDVAYDLGSATNRFRDLYLSGSTIDLGGTTLSVVGGTLQIGGVDINDVVTAAGVDYSEIQNTPDLFDGAFSSLSGTPTTLSGYGITDAFDGDYDSLTNKPDLTQYLTSLDGDLTGSVFADDSTLLVDGVNSKINLQNTVLNNTISTSDENFFINTAATPGDRGFTNITTTDSILDIQGAAALPGGQGGGVFINGGIPFDDPSDYTRYGDIIISGRTVSILVGDGEGGGGLAIAGPVIGTTVMDIKGSVFGDDSTVLVDGVAGKIVGDVENGRVITGIVNSEPDADLYVYAGGTGSVILAGQSDVSIGHGSGQVDIYGNVKFNSGTTLFQAANSVEFNCDVDFSDADVQNFAPGDIYANSGQYLYVVGKYDGGAATNVAFIYDDINNRPRQTFYGKTEFGNNGQAPIVDFDGATITGTNFLTSETTTSLTADSVNQKLVFTDETGTENDIDLSWAVDDTNLARLTSGSLDGLTGVATFTRDDATTFTVDFSALLNITLADLSVGADAAASGNGGLAYNNSTGVFTYTPPDLSSYIDLTDLSVGAPAAASGSGAIAYDPLTGVFTYTPPDILNSFSVVSNPASGNGTLTYNNSVGQFTYTPPDLSSYLTAETNDLTTAVTWANVPDANITESSVTQHEAALGINESQITFTSSFIELIDLSVTQLAASGNGTLSYNNATGVFTYTPPDLSGYLTSEANDLTASVTWANIPPVNVPELAVTQHQSAITISESQITDLGNYATLSDISLTINPATIGGAGSLSYNNTTGAFTFEPADVNGSVDAHLNTSTATAGQILSWTGTDYDWVADAGGIALTDLSVTVAAAGSANLSYNNTTGVFTYTPPDLSSYLTSETTTTLTADSVNQKLVFTDETGTPNDVDLSWAVDDTNLARIISGSVDGGTGVATFTRDDATTFTVDFSALFDDTNLTRITSGSVSGSTLTLTRSDATTVDVDVSSLLDNTDTIDYINAASFNTADGVLTLTGVGNAGATVDLDGRYLTSVAFADLTTTPTTISGYGITDAQPLDADLTAIAGLSSADGNFIVGSATGWVAESGATARTSLGLGSLATLSSVGAAQITDNSVGAAELNVSGNGTSGQSLVSDGDGTFSWTTISSDVVSDTTPQLGGNLDVNGNSITDNSGNRRIRFLLNSVNVLDIAELIGTTKLTTPSQMNFETTNGAIQFSAGGSTRDIIFRAGSPLNDKFRIKASGGVAINVGSGNGYELPATDGTAGQVITTDGSGNLSFTTPSSGISNVVEDTTPQLGGNLDTNGNSIGPATQFQAFNLTSYNGDITIDPSYGSTIIKGGIGTFFQADITVYNGITLNSNPTSPGSNGTVIDGLKYPSTDGSNGQVMTTDGSGNLSFADGGDAVYTPTTSTDWNGTAPTTVGEAIDRLAALVKTLNGGTGA